MLLLDTHILIWIAEGSSELSTRSVQRIDESRNESGLAVSSITFWEVAMLERRHRVSLSLPMRQWRDIVLDQGGILEVPVSGDLAIESVGLPGSLHSDPADRLIIATSRVNGWPLATRDARILDYAEAGHVNAVAI